MGMAKKKKFLLIDAHALIHRAFHALPPLTTKNGRLVNALYGFLLITMRALKDMKPDYVAVTFDSKGDTFRHKIYTAYKANRTETPDELISQFPLVREMMDAFGFPTFAVAGYEADDLIGTICKQYDKRADVETIIVTGDMDLLQLVDKNTKVLKVHKGVKETIVFDEAMVKQQLGLRPDQVIDYKALRGDASDNIPGVRGIGEKTAVELLQKYDTVENVFQHVADISGRASKPLQQPNAEKDARLSKELATIVQDAPLKFSLQDAAVGKYDRARITNLFQKYEFTSLLAQLKNLPGFEQQMGLFAETIQETENSTPMKERAARAKTIPVTQRAQGTEQYELVESEEDIAQLAATLTKQQIFAFDTETTGLNPLDDALVGMSFSWKAGRGYYVPAKNGRVPKELKHVFENPRIHKTGHNTKFDIEVLHHAGVNISSVSFDTMIASYLLNAGSRGHSLDNLAFVECGYEMQPIEELIGKGKNQISMRDVPVEKVSWYACEDADFSWRLYEKFLPRVEDKRTKTATLLHDIELPTMHVLVAMEEAGVKIDTRFLAKMSKKMHVRIAELNEEIQNLAGMEFNVASNVQLKEVLFKKMNLSTTKLKKTKTGVSTAADELEKLRGQHPIIDLLFEFRELSKLTSTYIDALPRLVNKRTGRIHTSFNQTIAATGRLSSTDPNLQNIPIRTELGREIRKAFIPEHGNALLSLDYSQIELRIVAHLAQDRVMMNAFKNQEDIHARTAAELNDVSLEQVTKDMRRAAKAINFGILYGMGVQGIMRDSGISREEARAFLDKYFTIHTGIRDYIEQIKTQTHKDGYAETLFGRRRYLPDIRSSNRMLAARAERAAVNMPTQGTAADIMKLAMIAVHKAIQAGKIHANMILQVHDELVFEVETKHVETEAKKIKKMMENVYILSVPLTVEAEYGDNWGEL
ncbi:MAG: DNA polymerase I [Candidatus Kerfeldbacteria bacterium]|nr:DNA polymerase I [Candidatus Kerfeldbacteria bacterium]